MANDNVSGTELEISEVSVSERPGLENQLHEDRAGGRVDIDLGH